MKYIWYEPLLEALRHHIEQNHMDQEDALAELNFTEEFLYYESFGNNETVSVGCPWSIHCNCKWEVSGELTYRFKPTSLKQGREE
jgi:hypothetical protein|tara:strand:- start:958 stop:1212 length:255 start_codon:yes stop_codon:yes gene_type:complete